MSNILLEADTPYGTVTVERIPSSIMYNVKVDGNTRHPNCSPEDAMRVLGGYLHGVSHAYTKLQKFHLTGERQ